MIKMIKSFKKTIWPSLEDQPSIIPIDDGVYRLEDGIKYFWYGEYKGGHGKFSIYIPTGFICDGQSVPRFGWSLSGMRPDGLVRKAALIHDFLYRSEGRGVWGEHERVSLSRKACDQIYRDCYMEDAPEQKRKAKFGYTILRMFGRKHFGGPCPRSEGGLMPKGKGYKTPEEKAKRAKAKAKNKKVAAKVGKMGLLGEINKKKKAKKNG